MISPYPEFGDSVLGKHYFARKGDWVALDVDAWVGADDLDDFVLVAPFEQFLQDSRAGRTCRTADGSFTILTILTIVFIRRRAVRQVAVVWQPLRQIRLVLTDDAELKTLRRFYIREIHVLVVTELTSAHCCDEKEQDDILISVLHNP